MARLPVYIDEGGDYQPGDPRPEGYLQRQEWARVQMKAGLVQRQCPKCSKWHFPQETCDQPATGRSPKGE